MVYGILCEVRGERVDIYLAGKSQIEETRRLAESGEGVSLLDRA